MRQTYSKRAYNTEEAARKDAAFQAYTILYNAGLLNDNLLPLCHDWNEDGGSQKVEICQITIEPQPSIWTTPTIREEYTAIQCQVVAPSHLQRGDHEPLRMMLLTRRDVLIPPSLYLHWDNSSTFQIQFAAAQPPLHTITEREANILHAVTIDLFRAPRSKSLWQIDGTPSAFVVPDMSFAGLEAWHASISNECTAADVFGQPINCIVRMSYPGEPAYICKGWLENSEGRGAICERLPKRRNFLLPPTEASVSEAAKRLQDGPSRRQQQVCKLEDCTFTSMPTPWARVGLFMPTILQHIQDHMTTMALISDLLSPIPIHDCEHILAALCAPSAQRRMHYQRHEFIGDSILKYVTSQHLFLANPDWPEGYLSQRRSLLVCNSTLTNAAKSHGLQRYIITTPIDFRHWTLPTDRESLSELEGRQVSSKVLADVVESLIGAVYLDTGLSAAVQCIHLFIPSVPPSMSPQAVQHSGVQTFAKREAVESLIGYTFNDPALLLEALTHPSCGRYLKRNSYERLEFLGDAVLDMIVTTELSSRINRLSQGQMTGIKAALVNARLLGFFCLNLRLQEYHRAVSTNALKETVEATQVHETSLASYLYFQSESLAAARQACEARYQPRREDILQALAEGVRYPWVELSGLSIDKVFSDIVESILGAIFLDAGHNLTACSAFIRSMGLQDYMVTVMDNGVDVSHPRNRLQQLVGSKTCSIIASRDHARGGYKCCVTIGDNMVVEVEDCFDEEEAITLAASKAEQLLLDLATRE